MRLIPEHGGTSPNHFSTWWRQEHTLRPLSPGKDLVTEMRDNLSHEILFGKNGWCITLYPEVRKDLFFSICDGWELPASFKTHGLAEYGAFGSQILDEGKFPNYGRTPAERLKTLSENVKAAGWRGAGLWICVQEAARGPGADAEFQPDYWTERLKWSRDADIRYWEVDWGKHAASAAFRRFLAAEARRIAPGLVIEHTVCCGGLNDEFGSGRVLPAYLKHGVEILSFSDVYRSYDVTSQLTFSTTLDRVGELLFHARDPEPGAAGLMCCEDEVYLAGSLGLTAMVMRSDAGRTDLDEVTRALRWQRLAPAFPARANDTRLSEQMLTDDWTFRGDTWYTPVDGMTVRQCAPAAVARGGLALPEVRSDTEPPFVTAAGFPGGEVAVGVFGRTHTGAFRDDGPCRNAELRLTLPRTPPCLALFGEVGRLVLSGFDPAGVRVLAADLLDKAPPSELSEGITRTEAGLEIEGAVLRRIGLSCASPGDTSRPGCILYFTA